MTNLLLYRALLELITAIGLGAFYCIFNGVDGIASALFDCDVHGIPFKCIIPNSRFFWVSFRANTRFRYGKRTKVLIRSPTRWPWSSSLST